jgi:isocitrate dehydrogenase kinase/phosphatase
MITHESTHGKLLHVGAHRIRQRLDTYQRRFSEITRRARMRFEDRDWPGMQADAAERLELYRHVVDRVVDELRQLFLVHIQNRPLWAEMRELYAEMIAGREDREIAETFFNSITRRIFATVGVDPGIEFVSPLVESATSDPGRGVWRTYSFAPPDAAVIGEVLSDYAFRADYENLDRDARYAAGELDAHLRTLGEQAGEIRLEMLPWAFYRGKGAYLVGRMVAGECLSPVVLALLNTTRGIALDAVLVDEGEVSILFSFARSYFHVEGEPPSNLVHFLRTLMPRKPVAELYIAIGYHKHGKTEIYRDLLRYLVDSDDRFELARGEPGMVMVVFTLPAYHLVFKVIRDRFALPKSTTQQAVREKYDLVFTHDRAGRLLDAQEFEHLKFKRDRFSAELLDKLRLASHNARIDGDHVVLRHLYVERRVIPLNLYLQEASGPAAEAAALDYGNAIKDLARSNIFPGDLLLKNFGVTRHGRVVFYDYDELSLLTACNFRAMPTARTDEEELSSEPWFAVGENDVFPEEFVRFLGLRGELRRAFLGRHADLFTVPFWQELQLRLRGGEIFHIFPYAEQRRRSLVLSRKRAGGREGAANLIPTGREREDGAS